MKDHVIIHGVRVTGYPDGSTTLKYQCPWPGCGKWKTRASEVSRCMRGHNGRNQVGQAAAQLPAAQLPAAQLSIAHLPATNQPAAQQPAAQPQTMAQSQPVQHPFLVLRPQPTQQSRLSVQDNTVQQSQTVSLPQASQAEGGNGELGRNHRAQLANEPERPSPQVADLITAANARIYEASVLEAALRSRGEDLTEDQRREINLLFAQMGKIAGDIQQIIRRSTSEND